jgi:hypothetical protein
MLSFKRRSRSEAPALRTKFNRALIIKPGGEESRKTCDYVERREFVAGDDRKGQLHGKESFPPSTWPEH